ncbi:unnamed protein product, partial [Ceratitis capitata]
QTTNTHSTTCSVGISDDDDDDDDDDIQLELFYCCAKSSQTSRETSAESKSN